MNDCLFFQYLIRLCKQKRYSRWKDYANKITSMLIQYPTNFNYYYEELFFEKNDFVKRISDLLFFKLHSHRNKDIALFKLFLQKENLDVKYWKKIDLKKISSPLYFIAAPFSWDETKEGVLFWRSIELKWQTFFIQKKLQEIEKEYK